MASIKKEGQAATYMAVSGSDQSSADDNVNGPLHTVIADEEQGSEHGKQQHGDDATAPNRHAAPPTRIRRIMHQIAGIGVICSTIVLFRVNYILFQESDGNNQAVANWTTPTLAPAPATTTTLLPTTSPMVTVSETTTTATTTSSSTDNGNSNNALWSTISSSPQPAETKPTLLQQATNAAATHTSPVKHCDYC